MNKAVALAAVVALCTAGVCFTAFGTVGGARFDGTSAASFEKSVASIRGSLPPERHAEFDRCYAWPEEHGKSGTRAFFVNYRGDILACDNAQQRYSGTAKTPAASAALRRGNEGLMNEPTAAGAFGNDAEAWTVTR